MKPCSLLAILTVLLTTGCATVLDGGGQIIAVNSYPSGATCSFVRGGRQIGVIYSTPGSIGVDKSRKTIVVTCTKPGYQPVVAPDPSMEDGMIYASLLFSGPFALVDVASAADYQYRTALSVSLMPLHQPYAGAPAAGF